MGKWSTTGSKCLHELLFSLNIGLAVAIPLRVHVGVASPNRSTVERLARQMIISIDYLLGLRPREYSSLGMELAFLCVIVGAGLVIAVVLRIVPEQARLSILRIPALVATVLAVPASVLYADAAEYAGTLWSRRITDNLGWLGLEGGLCDRRACPFPLPKVAAAQSSNVAHACSPLHRLGVDTHDSLSPNTLGAVTVHATDVLGACVDQVQWAACLRIASG